MFNKNGKNCIKLGLFLEKYRKNCFILFAKYQNYAIEAVKQTVLSKMGYFGSEGKAE